VVVEAALERKEVRRVRPLLSELQVPEWRPAAGGSGAPVGAEKGAEEHQRSSVPMVQEVGLSVQQNLLKAQPELLLSRRFCSSFWQSIKSHRASAVVLFMLRCFVS
jgi:hypothetical protein